MISGLAVAFHWPPEVLLGFNRRELVHWYRLAKPVLKRLR
jgi:hypothetical protein